MCILLLFYAKLQDVSVTIYTSIYWYSDDIGLCLCDDDVVCCVCLLHSYTYAFLAMAWIGKLATKAYALMPRFNWQLVMGAEALGTTYMCIVVLHFESL